MAQKENRTINLLEPLGQPNDAWTAAYDWVSTVGRYLMVGVEVLVLGVFIARFTLDKLNNDLTDEINNKVAILSNDTFRDQGVTFGNIHTLFSDIDKLERNQPRYSEEVSSILSGIPSNLTLDKFSFTTERITLGLLTTNIEDVKDYEFSLRKNTSYSDVQVSVSKSGETTSEISVNISFAINQEE
jgi:hypothetical protein